ncbi:protein AF-10 isoform X2 [Electrophorus electricus]|uniref:protein AF-10 isoform X2 n=1 Tax=Electrophorus electricus TaxID=8005 RepID=UPI0015D066C3|nr:protein AF-10 isoform X2 [Electrophorus electricus]
MVSGEAFVADEDDYCRGTMKEMIGGCCVCSDERGWAENPLVYCDGHGCNVAVHQACYGIVQVPTGPWFCRKCESQERAARVRCELCPHKDGALKRTDNGGWAHVVCALYIPEVEFANVSTMEPIVLQSVPHERYNKTCYICEEQGRESKAATGACMACNKHGCRQAFHVTCAQFAGLLCEEQGSDADNVKYCGYCKYHYSKLRRSKGRASRPQSLSDSPSHSLDKHHDKEKKKHKERDRHKPKHKKSLELSPSLVPSLMVTSEKSYNSSGSSGGGSVSSVSSSQKRMDDSGGRFTNANFQEVPSHSTTTGSKDGGSSDGKCSEGKSKKSGGHGSGSGSGSRGRKANPAKPHGPVVTMATSSTAPSSTSPFQQGLLMGSGSSKTASSTSVVPPTSDFLSFSDSSLRGGDSYAPPSFGRCVLKGGPEGGASEGMVALNTFGSLMSLPQSSASGSGSGKHYESPHQSGEVGGLASASYKRPQPSSSSSSSSAGEDGVKKKKRGNWRNRYGPCFTTQESKTPEGAELAAALPSSTSPSPSSSSAVGRPSAVTASSGGTGGLSCVGGVAGIGGVASIGGVAVQKSPSLIRNGSLQSLTVSSPPTGAATCPSSSDVAGPLPSAVLGGSLGVASSELANQQSMVTSMPSLSSLPPPAPFSSSSAHAQTNSLPGSFNMAQSHMFGNRLNPNSAMATLIAQSENSPADPELGDGALGFPRRGTPPKANLSPRSPLGGLHIRYEPSGPLVHGLGSSVDTLPPVATSIDQLLERQWNEGQQFLLQQGSQGDVLAMLRSLHQLQVENRRLEEQIRTLTMKKERLQLLSAQLSVPFTTATTTATTASPPLYPSNTHADMLNNKNIQLGCSVLTESSQPLPTQDLLSGGHSSGSSTSSLSTPPSASHSPSQKQLNGLAVPAATPAPAGASLPGMGVSSLAGALQSGHAAVTALNGVIQTSPGLPQNASPLPHPAGNPVSSVATASLPMSGSFSNSNVTTAKTSAVRLTEQQRQMFLQQQLQQLFNSQQSTAEPQQVLLYQLMQQHHELQQISGSQLLPATSSNPFLALHTEGSITPPAVSTARLL